MHSVSLWLLLCLWMWGIFFGEFQCLPVDDCSAVSCDSSALTRGSEHTSSYSAILNHSPQSFFIFQDFDNFEESVIWGRLFCRMPLKLGNLFLKYGFSPSYFSNPNSGRVLGFCSCEQTCAKGKMVKPCQTNINFFYSLGIS